MNRPPPPPGRRALDAFVDLAGRRAWGNRLAMIARDAAHGARAGRAVLQRHALELAIERVRRPERDRRPSPPELRCAALAAELAAFAAGLAAPMRDRLVAALAAAISGDNTLVPLFHLVGTAARQRARGFDVRFAGFEQDAPFDLLIERDGEEAEIVCDVMSAEEGRDVHRGAWVRLMDRIDPELQRWLADHPGRYLLKMTLPQGLRAALDAEGGDMLAAMHRRITAMLSERRRAHQDAAMVLRLDPLLLAAAQADESGLMSSLRSQFGPEAHLAISAPGRPGSRAGSVFVLAARAGRVDDIAAAIRRRMTEHTATRLSGTRPGILAMFVEDVHKAEWRRLRDELELEGETRRFMTQQQARSVVAVTCTSRHELMGAAAPDAAPEGELRFRNPAHPAARSAPLAAAVLSSP